MPDVLLHETAVSWLRNTLRRTKPEVVPWLETPVQWSKRMMVVVGEVNAGAKDVDGLCMSFPDRVAECLAEDGGRLRH